MIPVNTANEIDSDVEPVTVPSVALIVVEPGLLGVTSPFASILAMFPLVDDQPTNAVTSRDVPSLKSAAAVYCCVTDTGRLTSAGAIWMDVIEG